MVGNNILRERSTVQPNGFVRRLIVAGVLALACSTETLASRGNVFGLARAATSTVDYTKAIHEPTSNCDTLAALATNGVTITTKLVDATTTAPAHCRVNGTIPAEIGFQVNLPTKWNGRLFMYGNGGFAGEGAEDAGEVESREAGLKAGFATARTDTGHLAAKEPLGTFAYNRLDKVQDHGHRAVHETAVMAKKLINAFYARPASFSYWQGCSTGGREGMMEASKYPEDFDGISAAAPTLRWSDVMMKGLSNQLALDAAPTLTSAKLKLVFKAVLDKCDAKDGVADGLLADPRTCDFNPKNDLPKCTGSAGDSCFTEAETDSLAKIRNGPVIKGQSYFPQYPGIEDPTTATRWILNPDGTPNILSVFGESYMKYMFFLPAQYPTYDWKKSFDFNVDPGRSVVIDDIWNPKANLDAFKARKGKIITYWGLADGALNPIMGMDYYKEIVKTMGLAQTQDFYRMYLVPGVAHCSGGYGPDEIDSMTPLIEWVEAGKVPDRLLATKTAAGVLKYNRAICPYPQATVYGSGDPEKTENYTCVTPLSEVASGGPLDKNDDGGGGCTISRLSRDASLPLLAGAALMGLFYRRKRV